LYLASSAFCIIFFLGSELDGISDLVAGGSVTDDSTAGGSVAGGTIYVESLVPTDLVNMTLALRDFAILSRL